MDYGFKYELTNYAESPQCMLVCTVHLMGWVSMSTVAMLGIGANSGLEKQGHRAHPRVEAGVAVSPAAAATRSAGTSC